MLITAATPHSCSLFYSRLFIMPTKKFRESLRKGWKNENRSFLGKFLSRTFRNIGLPDFSRERTRASGTLRKSLRAGVFGKGLRGGKPRKRRNQSRRENNRKPFFLVPYPDADKTGTDGFA